MVDITIVNGVYKPTYNWGGTTLNVTVPPLSPPHRSPPRRLLGVAPQAPQATQAGRSSAPSWAERLEVLGHTVDAMGLIVV